MSKTDNKMAKHIKHNSVDSTAASPNPTEREGDKVTRYVGRMGIYEDRHYGAGEQIVLTPERAKALGPLLKPDLGEAIDKSFE